MIRLVLVLLSVAGALPACAETVRVLSGEHPGFTRLAIVFAEPTDWQFGRVDQTGEQAANGVSRDPVYEIRLERDNVALDISDVFSKIPRTRLAALSVPGERRLRLAVAPGHRAVPFELRAGVVVIDIRPGLPPEGSPFEKPLPTYRVASAPAAFTAVAVRSGDPAGVPDADFWSDYLWNRLQRPQASKPGAAMDGPATANAASDLVDRGPRNAGKAALLPSLATHPAAGSARIQAAAQVSPLPGSALAGLIPPDPSSSRQTSGQPAARPAVPLHESPSVSPTPDIASAQDLLIRQLSRAAAQGLIKAPRPGLAGTSEVDGNAVAPATLPNDQHRTETRPPSGPQINVTAQTSMDRDGFARVRRALTGGEATCPDPETFDVASWGRDKDPAQLVAEGRLALLGEFDRVSDGAVADLARRYIYLGFGAEAAAVMRAFPVEFPERGRLQSLAAIMDGKPAGSNAAILDFARCEGAVALWSLLARAPGVAVPDLNLAAVRRSFSDLPGHLRDHLGYGLAERLIALGEEDAAASVRNAVGRRGPSGAALADLIDLNLSAQTGGATQDNPTQSEDRLLAAIGSDGPQTVPALMIYLEGRLAHGLPVSDAFAQQTAALAFEHRNAPDGPALMRAEVLARAAAGDFAAAFAALDRARARKGAQEGQMQQAVGSATASLLDLLATKASDIVFLEHAVAMAQDRRRLSSVPPQSLVPVSERLLALGFPTEARAIREARGSNDAETRLFLARTELASGRAQDALRTVAGLDGAAAERIRAQSLVEIGDPALAMSAFDRIGDPESAARAAWLSGDWESYLRLRSDSRATALRRLGAESATGNDDGAVRAAARASTEPVAQSDGGRPQVDLMPIAAGPEGVLAGNRALLQQSRDIRAALADLRAELPVAPVESLENGR